MKGVEGLFLPHVNERKFHRPGGRLVYSCTFTETEHFARFSKPVFSTLGVNILAELLEKG